MAFYKLCDCGFKNMFDGGRPIPQNCEKCSKSLINALINEEITYTKKNNEYEDTHTIEVNNYDLDFSELDNPNLESGIYSLDEINDKYSITIPRTGGIVGRATIGSDYLKSNPSISREHLRVEYDGNNGLIIEDLSKFGTFLNGSELTKGSMNFAHDGDIIKLSNLELRVCKKS